MAEDSEPIFFSFECFGIWVKLDDHGQWAIKEISYFMDSGFGSVSHTVADQILVVYTLILDERVKLSAKVVNVVQNVDVHFYYNLEIKSYKLR